MFQCLGEIWYNLSAIEFIMRCALSKKAGQENLFPKPPYQAGRTYSNYPNSFNLKYFSNVVDNFIDGQPNKDKWAEIVDFRNALAHGLIAEIDKSGKEELVHFKVNGKQLQIKSARKIELENLKNIRDAAVSLRRHLAVDFSRLQ